MVLNIWAPVDEDFVNSLAPLQNPETGPRGRFCNLHFLKFLEILETGGAISCAFDGIDDYD